MFVLRPRIAVSMLQRGESDEIDRFLEQLDRGRVERKEICPVDEGVLLDGENRAQCVRDRAVLPFVARGDFGAARIVGKDDEVAGGRRNIRNCCLQHGTEFIDTDLRLPLRGVSGLDPHIANQSLLQRDLLGARVEVERRSVDEILQPVGGGVALRIALRLELIDLFDDGRNLGDCGHGEADAERDSRETDFGHGSLL